VAPDVASDAVPTPRWHRASSYGREAEPLRPPGPDGPPHLWLVGADGLGGPHQDAGKLLALLDATERAQAEELHRPAARRVYLAGHAALRDLLGRYTGTPAAEVRLDHEACPLCDGPHGRPRLATADIGGIAVPLHFSLSRAGGLTLLAFAAAPVGADIATVPRPSAVAALTRRLHPDERAELATLPPPARPEALARAWVRKEALLKGLGTGLARPLDRDYVGTGPSPTPVPHHGWALDDVRCPRGFLAAVALASPGARPHHDGRPGVR
jgi:4'-phosphopantetheinyl transferase